MDVCLSGVSESVIMEGFVVDGMVQKRPEPSKGMSMGTLGGRASREKDQYKSVEVSVCSGLRVQKLRLFVNADLFIAQFLFT